MKQSDGSCRLDRCEVELNEDICRTCSVGFERSSTLGICLPRFCSEQIAFKPTRCLACDAGFRIIEQDNNFYCVDENCLNYN